MREQEGLPPTGWAQTLCIFGAAGALLFLVTHSFIPALHLRTGWEPILLWFVLGGLGVFLPLILLGLGLLRQELRSAATLSWADRLRFRRLSAADWRWTFGGFVLIAFLSVAVQSALAATGSGLSRRRRAATRATRHWARPSCAST
jgi:hypothetical protein